MGENWKEDSPSSTTGLFPTYALVAVMQSHKIPDGLQPSDSSPFARNKNVAGE